jgi:UDP-N-acetylglucosamine 2-epimerase
VPMKVATIVGTRPEVIRLSEVIRKLDDHFDHLLVHTGQNWDDRLNQIFFDELKLRSPDVVLSGVGNNLGESIGRIIAQTYGLLESESPDALLVLGDTNSALSAISAKRLKIPVFHMEAGNRCFDENVPEEINRRIVDHIADVNLPYTEHARRYLLAEGVRGGFIFVTGSPMPEVIAANRDRIASSTVLTEMGLDKQRYVLVSAHREENVDSAATFAGLIDAINEIAETYELPVVYSVHPRSMHRIEAHGFTFHPKVRLERPFGFIDYCCLQLGAFCVLSDSGTLSEESAVLNFPAVLIRTSTERPEALENGVVILGGNKFNGIVQSVELSRSLHIQREEYSLPVDYVSTNVSAKVVRIIQSYTPVVNRVVWAK